MAMLFDFRHALWCQERLSYDILLVPPDVLRCFRFNGLPYFACSILCLLFNKSESSYPSSVSIAAL